MNDKEINEVKIGTQYVGGGKTITTKVIEYDDGSRDIFQYDGLPTHEMFDEARRQAAELTDTICESVFSTDDVLGEITYEEAGIEHNKRLTRISRFNMVDRYDTDSRVDMLDAEEDGSRIIIVDVDMGIRGRRASWSLIDEVFFCTKGGHNSPLKIAVGDTEYKGFVFDLLWQTDEQSDGSVDTDLVRKPYRLHFAVDAMPLDTGV